MKNKIEVAYERLTRDSAATKREHFAGLAMQAIISGNVLNRDCTKSGTEAWIDGVATQSCRIADKLLEELSK